MICFAAIAPHPPIIIPGIGKVDDIIQAQKTIIAMKRLREELKKIKLDTAIVISPHAPLSQDFFGINSSKNLIGDFSDFGIYDELEFQNDLVLAAQIQRSSLAKNINVKFFESALDHGALVPLYYLFEDVKTKLVHLSFSGLDFKTHERYGEIIGQAVEKDSKRVAIIASGDLSHRLIPGAPAGYSAKGKEFDQKLIEFLKAKKEKDILDFNIDFIEQAGECGLRSVIMLLGMIRPKEWNFNLLSYEGPFGVGYMVARLI